MKIYTFFTLFVITIFSRVDAFVPSETFTSNAANNVLLQKYAKAARWIPATYFHCLTHRPLATESVTAGCMAGLGDYLAQRKSKKPYNPKRSIHFILKGLGEGIMWSIWYHKADRWVATLTEMAVGSGWLAPGMTAVYRTIWSLLLDLFVACPLIFGLWDIPFPAMMSGTPLREIPRQIKSKLGELLVASVKLWMPVNVLIYNSPLRYRVLMMATADVFWQSIVSAVTSRELVSDEEYPQADKQQQRAKLIAKPVPSSS